MMDSSEKRSREVNHFFEKPSEKLFSFDDEELEERGKWV